MVACKEINELIHTYIDKESNPEESIIVEEHLKDCTKCQNKIAIFNNLKKSLKEKIVFSRAPDSLKEKVLAISQRRPLLILLPLRWAVGFATLLIFLISGIYFYQNRIPYLSIKDNVKVTQHFKDCKDCRKGVVKLIKNHMKILSQIDSLQIHLNTCPFCKESAINRAMEHIQKFT